MLVTLKTLAPLPGRLTSKPDMAPGDRLEWSGNDVVVFADGSFSVSKTVRSFKFRIKHRRWGSWATVVVS